MMRQLIFGFELNPMQWIPIPSYRSLSEKDLTMYTFWFGPFFIIASSSKGSSSSVSIEFMVKHKDHNDGGKRIKEPAFV